MNSSRTNITIVNSLWGFVEKTITFICPFVVRTILIYRMGADYSGVGSLFASVLSFLNLAELGFSNAIIFHMYKPIADSDHQKICSLLNVYKKAYRVIGIFVLTLGLIITPFIPKLIKDDIPSGINIYIIYLVFLFNSVVGYFLFSYKTSILSAYQREDVLSKNLLIYNLLLCFMQCVAIVLSKNYYLFVLAVPFCTIFLNFLNNLEVKKKYPYLEPNGDISEDEKKTLRKELYGLMIWKLGGASRNSFDGMFISALVGLVAITSYDNYFQIVNFVSAMIGVLCTSINAGVGYKIASKSIEENFEDFKRFHFLYMWITGWCTVCIFCLIQPFMKIWMGEDLMLPFGMVVLFCYYFFMMKKGDINSIYYHASGLWWEGKYRSVFEAILNLVLNYYLGVRYGLFGIIIATIISFSVVNIYGASIVFTKYFKNKKYYIYILENLFFLFVTSLSCYVTYFLGNTFIGILDISSDLINLLVFLMICITLPNVIMLLIYGCFSQYRKNVSYVFWALKGFVK